MKHVEIYSELINYKQVFPNIFVKKIFQFQT